LGDCAATAGSLSQPIHHLVHGAPIEIGADTALCGVDEFEHLLVRDSPIEGPGVVSDVAVQ